MNENSSSIPDPVVDSATITAARPKSSSLTKTLPTERVASEKQLGVLRAYAAASGPDKKAVTNDEVAAVHSELAASSVSLCNPFFADVGLLIPDGRKQRPSDAVFDYLHAYEWNPETAALKLGRVMSDSWAAKTLTTRLTFRSLTKDDAIGVLADESKATKAHRRNLEILLDFLTVSGVVKIDGGTVFKGSTPQGATPAPPPTTPEQHSPVQEQVKPPDKVADMEEFTIPIPFKKPTTISFPKDIDAEDWQMVMDMTIAYMRRLKGFEVKP